MPNQVKYDRILDALQELLENQKMQTISVSENYEKPLRTAKALAYQTDISPFTRMAMIFQACRNSSTEFVKSEDSAGSGAQEKALLHQKYINHIITELKPVLAEIIRQGITAGEIHFEDSAALAEIVLIVLTVKMDNTLVPSDKEEIEDTISTENPPGSLNFLKSQT